MQCSREKLLENVERIRHDPGAEHRNRLGILLGNSATPQTKTLTHTLWSLLNVLPPGELSAQSFLMIASCCKADFILRANQPAFAKSTCYNALLWSVGASYKMTCKLSLGRDAPTRLASTGSPTLLTLILLQQDKYRDLIDITRLH